MNRISWLHISDLHISPQGANAYAKAADQKDILDKFLEFLGKESRNLPGALRAPDLIFATGDLAYAGNREQYSAKGADKVSVDSFVNRVAKCLKIQTAKRFFPVPGNHDVCRTNLDENLELPNLQLLVSDNTIGDFLLKKSDHREMVLKRLEHYAAFLRKAKKWSPRTAIKDVLWYADSPSIKGDDNKPLIGIAGLCSSWLSQSFWKCFLDPHGFKDWEEPESFLSLGAQLARDTIKKAKKSAPKILVALMHHRYDLLAYSERQVVADAIHNSCHFVLCGHAHKHRLYPTPLGNNTHLIQAGSLFLDKEHRNSFNIVELDLEIEKPMARMLIAKYDEDNASFKWMWEKQIVLDAKDRRYGYEFDKENGVLTFPVEIPVERKTRPGSEKPNDKDKTQGPSKASRPAGRAYLNSRKVRDTLLDAPSHPNGTPDQRLAKLQTKELDFDSPDSKEALSVSIPLLSELLRMGVRHQEIVGVAHHFADISRLLGAVFTELQIAEKEQLDSTIQQNNLWIHMKKHGEAIQGCFYALNKEVDLLKVFAEGYLSRKGKKPQDPWIRLGAFLGLLLTHCAKLEKPHRPSRRPRLVVEDSKKCNLALCLDFVTGLASFETRLTKYMTSYKFRNLASCETCKSLCNNTFEQVKISEYQLKTAVISLYLRKLHEFCFEQSRDILKEHFARIDSARNIPDVFQNAIDNLPHNADDAFPPNWPDSRRQGL